MGAALTGALERASTDKRGRFRVDQLLIKGLGRGADPVGDIGELQLSKKFEQGRLI